MAGDLRSGAPLGIASGDPEDVTNRPINRDGVEPYLLWSDHEAFNKRALAPFFVFIFEQVAVWIETPRFTVM